MKLYQTHDENRILITGNFSINSWLSTTALNEYLLCPRENKLGGNCQCMKTKKKFGSVKLLNSDFTTSVTKEI